jgi:hypothetical protein
MEINTVNIDDRRAALLNFWSSVRYQYLLKKTILHEYLQGEIDQHILYKEEPRT